MRKIIMNQAHEVGFVPLEITEGQSIEAKVAKIVENNEPITDGAPPIFTEKKEGVRPETNIRTDKWDIALTAMDKANKAKIAKGQSYGDPEPPTSTTTEQQGGDSTTPTKE